MTKSVHRNQKGEVVLDVELTLRGELAQTLLDHAKKRGVAPVQLLASIVSFVLKDDLVNAVIDDGDGK
jgi:Tfp pilus assembly ATPase PilU